MAKKIRITVVLVTLLVISLPYIGAELAGGSQWKFAGFLLNPMDGASYLAKMRMGYEGEWRFTLPFTAERGEGAYLFLFYLGLGHIARIVGLPLILVYHLARAAGSTLLVFMMASFLQMMYPAREDLQRNGLWLLSFGAGLGWLVIFVISPPPADFWIAEAYPFLSMYANPHFPLGLALILGSLVILMGGWSQKGLFTSGPAGRAGVFLLLGLCISIILPFGLVVLLLTEAGWLGWELVKAVSQDRRTLLLRFGRDLIFTGLLGGPFLLYQYWVAVTDPLLRGWNAQNITVTPPVWDLLLSFSPGIILALYWLWARRNVEKNPVQRMAAVWLFMALILAVFPFPLQRRFLLGFYIPITGLAVGGLDVLAHRWLSRKALLWRLYFGISLPSTLLTIIIGLFGVIGRSPLLYLSADEAQAMRWIAANTPEDSLVAAAPEMGQWIPGFTGRRVIYGHPYETIHADEEKAWVTAVYNTPGGADRARLEARGVDYLLFGPREREINPGFKPTDLDLVYEAPHVKVYAVGDLP